MLRVLALAALLSACQAEDAGRGPGTAQAATQSRADLYACEGCEGALERDAASLSWQARVAGPDEPGQRMLLRGRVLRSDGVTPAPDVVVYAYHTNTAGLYANGSPETEWSRRHGRLRGWVRTGADGRYEFATIKPGRYPDRTDPAHVHLTVVEPGRRPYWIDDVVFAGESGVDAAYRNERENQGGAGIVTLQRTEDGAWLAERNILLERHPE